MSNLPEDKDTRAEYWNNGVPAGAHVQGEITPNVVIQNSSVRTVLTVALSVLSFLASVAALALGFFPELSDPGNVFPRVVSFVIATITLASGTYGITVIVPNIPKR